MKVINTNKYVDLLRELSDKGQLVSMQISGTSMTPFLGHHRDYIYFEKPKRELKKGDMVFYQRDSGQYVMHRICKVHRMGTDPRGGNTGTGTTYDIVGDAQHTIEKNVRRDQIFALIVKVKRKGKMIGPGDFWWDFFEKVWINIIPLRSVIRGGYFACAGVWKKFLH